MSDGSDGDRFVNLPEVCREKIFRFSRLFMQQRIAKAYRNTSEEHVLDRFRVHKQPIHCWICMSRIYLNRFWPIAVGYRDGEIMPSFMSRAPRHGTDGFKILYTLQETNEFESREAYRLRDFTTDDSIEADQVFQAFLDEIDKVPTVKSIEEMEDHIEEFHATVASFDERFFEVFQEFRGEIFLYFVKIFSFD